ncbi:uncharacterized protein B0H18DRAFT_1208439 [Fomitopsis serialis]|uniref:uncharacterized protein n=1 Tax=Fomitopsis serialis TaxID=139415 RepID=UPI0020075E23|nr:uncharacterized protein B0H18DRAFT_1208439 [Neoantrodia serialis]KAH9932545.1 hypothetical protein B0H18DRAFT_1208439 [Neoantrodia serialis]
MPVFAPQATVSKPQKQRRHRTSTVVKPRQLKAWSASELNIHAPSSSMSLPPSLPTLRLPIPESLAVTIEVEGTPERNGIVLTWIVEERPVCHIERGLPIVLMAGDLRTGVGRVDNATDIQRHWITWILTGSPAACAIRVPTSWSRLTRDEVRIHAHLYAHLPHSPPPHRLLAHDPVICNSTDSPYQFESDEDLSEAPQAEIRGGTIPENPSTDQ